MATDIERIYDKIEKVDSKHDKKAEEIRSEMNLMMQSFHGHMADMTTTSAVMSERFKQLSKQVSNIPALPKRPCGDFEAHIAEHKEYRFIWVKSIVGAIVAAVLAAAGTAWAVLTGAGK